MNVATVYLPTEDFPLSHPSMPSVLNMLGKSDMLLVKREPEYPAGGCYNNVSAHCSRNGGRPVYGWMIELVPRVYIEAMHHAVWQRPDGELLDITHAQNRQSSRLARTSFIPDQRYKPDTSGAAFFDNRYVDLVDDPDVASAHAAYFINNKALRESKDLRQAHAAGKIDIFRYNSALKRLDATLKDSFKAMHEHRLAIKKRYFKTK